MADNVPVTAGTGTTVATDDVSGVHYQYVKLADGTADSSTPIAGSADRGLYVDPHGTTALNLTTPTISNASIYAVKDAIGGIMSWSSAARISGGGGILESVSIVDKGQQMAALDLVLFSASPSGTFTDNAAFDPTDADLATVVGVVPFVAGDYYDFNDNSVAHRSGLGIVYGCAVTTLYGAIISRGTPTYTSTSDLDLILGLVPD